MTQLDKIEESLEKLHRKVDRIARTERIQTLQGENLMALSQDIMDAVTAETTVLDSFIALIQGLIDNNTIPPAAGQAILTALASNKAKIEAAITANTPPGPSDPVIETKWVVISALLIWGAAALIIYGLVRDE